jgi:NitT/TauT family transport system permease protein
VRNLFSKIQFGIKSWIPAAITLVVFLTIWYGLSRLTKIPPYLLPSPDAVLKRMCRDIDPLIRNLTITTISTLVGFFVGSLVGWSSAILFSLNRTFERAFYPYFITLKSIPIVVIAPMIALWMGTDIAGRITVVALSTFFPILVNSLKGLAHIDNGILELALAYRASSWQIFFRLRLPGSLPYLFAGMKVSAVLSVVAALVSEMMGADSGLGFILTVSIYRTDTEALFCVTLLSALLALIVFGIVVFWEQKGSPWIKGGYYKKLKGGLNHET